MAVIHDADHLVARGARLGVVINLAIPAAIALLAYAIRAVAAGSSASPDSPSVAFIALVVLAVADLVGAFILRRKLFSAKRVRSFRHDPVQMERWFVRASTLVFAVGASPMVYGAALYLWSGDLRHLAFFGVISLLAYRLFRPTEDLLNGILNPVNSHEEVSS